MKEEYFVRIGIPLGEDVEEALKVVEESLEAKAIKEEGLIAVSSGPMGIQTMEISPCSKRGLHMFVIPVTSTVDKSKSLRELRKEYWGQIGIPDFEVDIFHVTSTDLPSLKREYGIIRKKEEFQEEMRRTCDHLERLAKPKKVGYKKEILFDEHGERWIRETKPLRDS